MAYLASSINGWGMYQLTSLVLCKWLTDNGYGKLGFMVSNGILAMLEMVLQHNSTVLYSCCSS